MEKTLDMKTTGIPLLVTIVALALSGCDQLGGFTGEKKEAKKGATTPQDGFEKLDEGETSKASNQADSDGEGSKKASAGDSGDASAPGVFALFCKKAAESGMAKELSSALASFCKNGEPTKLLSESLIGRAYDGDGQTSKAVVLLEDPKHDAKNKTTALEIGVAIKIPISAKEHFEKIGPLLGDPDEAKRLGAYPKGSDVTITIDDSREKTGKYHVRGWTSDVITETTVVIATVRTHAVVEDDQWELVPDQVYMYTSYLSEAIERVEVTNLLTALIQVNEDDAYLIARGSVRLKNDGLPTVAETTLKDTIKQLVANMYNVAKE